MLIIISSVLILTYLIFLKVVSFKAHLLFKKTSEDYFLVGRSISGYVLWLTVLATMVNSLAFTAVPGLIYKGGVLFAQMWVVVLVMPALFYYFGPALNSYARRKNHITQGELFGDYYNSRSIKLIVAIIGIISVFPFLTIQLSSIAKVVTVVSKGSISYSLALSIFTASIGLYVYYGGARAVIWTDVIQGICFFALLLVSFFLFSKWSGGFLNSFARIEEHGEHLLSFNPKTHKIFISNILSWPFAFFLWPQLFQRVLMANSSNEIRKASKVTLVLFGLTMFLIMSLGFFATSVFIGEGIDSDTIVAAMYQKFMPLGSSLIVLAVVASAMSTVDSGLLSLASIIGRDFSIKKDTGVNKARFFSLIVLFVVFLFALSPAGRGAIVPLVTLGASFATLLLWPLIYFRLGYSSRSVEVSIIMLFGFIAIVLNQFGFIGLNIGSGTAGFVFSLSTMILVEIFHVVRMSLRQMPKKAERILN